MIDDEYLNPCLAARRAQEWPEGHDIGIFISAGDSMRLIGTARDADDLIGLLRGVAEEWRRLLLEPDWYFTDFVH